ncbi:MAG: glycosyltransferase [Desulfurococcaceae archaeon]
MLIAASGGGHTEFAIAIAEELGRLGVNYAFVVPRGDELTLRRLAAALGRVEAREVEKPLNPQERLYKVVWRLPAALLESLARVRGAGAFVCTGSNHGVLPALVASFLRGSRVVCVEDFYRIYRRSRSVSLVSELLGAPVLLHWRSQRRLYAGRGLYVGPICGRRRYEPRDEGYVFFTMGTMGHRALARLLARVEGLPGYGVVVQSGRIDPEYIRRRHPSWRVFRYDPDLDRWLAGASLVVAHQGVTAIKASQAYGKPLVIAFNPDIPLAGGRDDARAVADEVNATFVGPSELEGYLGRPEDFVDLLLEAAERKPARHPNGAALAARAIASMISGR